MEQPTLVIRGGTIVDGTGAAPFVGDIAIQGRVISAVGRDLPVRGAREIDASGLIVAPGWVDPHTHYDGQVTWDPYLSPSTSAGVTTAVMGNCGIGFAPCQAELRDFIVDLMDAVEDIPGSALNEGIKWEWETFPEYLDAISRKPLACDVGVLVGHAGVRTWVLGRRASISDRPGGPENDPVKPEEIEQMAKVVEEAVAAGALGFSTSRVMIHRDKSGTLTPGSLASYQEMRDIGDAIARGGGGCFELATDFITYDDLVEKDLEKIKAHFMQEWRWIEDIVTKHPGVVSFTFGANANMDPNMADGWKFALKKLEDMKAKGGKVNAQTMIRLGGLHFSLASNIHPLLASAKYRKIHQDAQGAMGPLLQALRDPGSRQVIVSEVRDFYRAGDFKQLAGMVGALGPLDTVWPWDPSYEPAPEDCVKARAAREGRSAVEVIYDVLSRPEEKHGGVLWRPLFNYARGDLESVRESLQNDIFTPGFADGGAHVRFVCDATTATHLLTHWVRDRTRGPKFPIEFVVKKHTKDTAAIFGMTDRGELRPGMKADLNLIDLDGLRILAPRFVHDLPLQAGRWVQDVEGYRMTIVSGEVTFQDGKPTGALPGGLVRNALSVGLAAGPKGTVPPAARDVAVPELDLKDHALTVIMGNIAGPSAAGRAVNSDKAEPAQAKL